MRSIYVLMITALSCLSAIASAQQTHPFPGEPINFIVPFSAGGSSDNIVRLLADEMARDLGQPVVVQNITGATGTIGAKKVSRSPANGYSLVLLGGTTSLYTMLNPQSGLDFERDFAPVAAVAHTPFLLVANKDLPINSVDGLVEYGKSKGSLNHGSAGVGGVAHLTSAVFGKQAGINLVNVPFKGSSDALAAVAGGHVDIMFESFGTSTALVKSGRLKALAILAAERSPLATDLPTIKEAGYPDLVQAKSWFGAFAAAGTPPAILERLNGSITSALATPNIQARLREMGMESMNMTLDQFNRFIRDDSEGWRRLITKYQIEVN